MSPSTSHAPRAVGEPAGPKATTVALVGRPNCGKSSLFNQITGGSARVGNYPGITVDVLESSVDLPSGVTASFADLPGLYSVESTVARDTDEAVARTFIDRLKEQATREQAKNAAFVVVQVVDPTRLALGLRLTKELARAEVPFLVALTHADVLTAEGRELDVIGLSQRLGVPVVLVSSHDAGAKATVLGAIDDHLRALTASQPSKSFDPVRLAREVVRDLPPTAEVTRRRALTERLDGLLLGPVIGPLLFVAVMALVFAAVFLVADPVTEVIDKLVALAKSAIERRLGDGLLSSFLSDGILSGAGTVLAFMPQIVILAVALELLEASGYLARGAFLVDRTLRLMGLSGRSFLPLLMGHACAIPAISATRVVRDPRERLTTILVLPLMTCSARLPTYGLVLAAFFAGSSAFFRAALFVGLYFASILMALVVSLVLRRTATKGKGLPLVLEMPAYRVPQGGVVARKAYHTARRFLRDVGTTIVVCSAILWGALKVPMPGAHPPEGTAPIEASIAATVGRAIEPLTRPAGFDWRIDVGLIGSFGQRELMVATLGIVYGIESAEDEPAPLAQKLSEAKRPDGSPLYGVRTGLAILVFFMLAAQCMSTIAAIKRETKSWKWAGFVVGYTYALAYCAAVLVYQLGALFGLP